MDIISALNNYWILIPLIVWTLIWKAVALWRSARRGAKVWFAVFLVLNTIGILEIIYIFFITKEKENDMQTNTNLKNSIKKKII